MIRLLASPAMMLQMQTALIIVDVQRDLLSGGSVEVPGGDAVIPVLQEIAKEADLVIVTGDLHPPDHCSFIEQGGEYPPNCVKGTGGARISPKLRKLSKYTIWKGTESDQQDFSGFAGATLRPRKTLKDVLDDNGFKKGDRVLIGGLVFEICVKNTALDAAAYGFETIVFVDATRSLTIQGEIGALEDLDRAGVLIQVFDPEQYYAWLDGTPNNKE